MSRRRICMLVALLVGLAPMARADEFKRERRGDEQRDKAKEELEGKPAPALVVKDWLNTQGKDLSLVELKGKVVVLDFWGVWCGPCRAAMPHLKELYEKHKDAGLVVIGVHTTNQGEKMADYVKEEKLPWPVAVDVEKGTVTAFAVDSYPDYYLIDRQGKLRMADLANSELDSAVEELLKETAAP